MRTGWIESAAIPATLLCVYLLRSNHWLSVHVRTVWDWIKAWARLAPFATTLWLLVAVHAWMLVGLPPKLRDQVLLTHSTTLAHLRREPITVLFSSAMWTDVSELLFLTGTALVYLGPLERWLGTWRTLLAFLAGHIGATLLLAVWLEQTVASNPAKDKVLSRTIDVGVSYGAYCCASLLAYRLRMPYRILVWFGLGTYLLYQATLADYDVAVDYTAIGHLLSFGIGILLYPLTRTPKAAERRNDPWIHVRRPAAVRVRPSPSVSDNETAPIPR
jgi:membrane associated rhomboid family serine protease